jgi:cold shock CspA family protein
MCHTIGHAPLTVRTDNKRLPGSMATFEKREKEKKRQQKQEEKKRKKEERKANSAGGGLDNMMAYVDEFGRLTDTPPDPAKFKPIDISEIEIGVPKRTEEEEVAAERTGRVDFFDASKGFGFIREDGSQERFFVHVSHLSGPVGEGDKVRFEVERGPKGMNAVRVDKV